MSLFRPGWYTSVSSGLQYKTLEQNNFRKEEFNLVESALEDLTAHKIVR